MNYNSLGQKTASVIDLMHKFSQTQNKKFFDKAFEKMIEMKKQQEKRESFTTPLGK